MLKIKPFELPAKATSGISISQGESRGRAFFRIGFTADAQKEHFGGQLTKDDAIALSIDPKKNANHLLQIDLVEADAAEGVPLMASARSSVFVKLEPWVKSPGAKRPAEALTVVAKLTANSIKVKLPEWARPLVGQGQGIMD